MFEDDTKKMLLERKAKVVKRKIHSTVNGVSLRLQVIII